jgi:hypothetical protein
MQKRLMIILLSLVVGLTTCNRGKITEVPTGELKNPEYDVLSAFIASKFADRKNKEPSEPVGDGLVKIVISDTTQSGDDEGLHDENGRPIPWEKTAESLRKKTPTLQQTTIDSFREVNAKQASLRRSFHPAIDYELVDSIKIDSIFTNKGDPWGAYYKQFPGSQGILTFSRVGFSADGRQAFFYVSNRCGGLCGGGRYVVMENSNGRWIIGKEVEKWVS